MTLLVGPNGSGKSNFVDGLRFIAQSVTGNLDAALRERGGVAEVRRFRSAIPSSAARITSSPSVTGYWSARHRAPCLLHPQAGINVLSLNPESMRQLQEPDAGDALRRDGSNVASVLERPEREDPDVKHRIEEYLSRTVPDIDSADRRGFGAWESLEFRQHVAGAGSPWTFPATSMSDGTLRALGVLVALFAAGDVYSPIGVEEPEVAVHPAAAGLVLEALQGASQLRQVIATSRSPDLLVGC